MLDAVLHEGRRLLQLLLLTGSGSGAGAGATYYIDSTRTRPSTNARLAIADAVLAEDADSADVIAHCVPSGAVTLPPAPARAVPVELAVRPAFKAEALVGPVGHDVPDRLDGPAAVGPTLGDPATFGPAAETL